MKEELEKIFDEMDKEIFTDDLKTTLSSLFEKTIESKKEELVKESFDATQKLKEEYEKEKQEFIATKDKEYEEKYIELSESIDQWLVECKREFFEENKNTYVNEAMVENAKKIHEMHKEMLSKYCVDIVALEESAKTSTQYEKIKTDYNELQKKYVDAKKKYIDTLKDKTISESLTKFNLTELEKDTLIKNLSEDIEKVKDEKDIEKLNENLKILKEKLIDSTSKSNKKQTDIILESREKEEPIKRQEIEYTSPYSKLIKNKIK